MTQSQVNHFKEVMNWTYYEEEESIPDEIKLTLLNTGYRKNSVSEGGDSEEVTNNYFIAIEIDS